MPVLVTGATGLLGSHVVEVLAERGESVRALARRCESVNQLADSANVQICRGDLADRTSLREAVRGVDRVLHCAARTGVWGPRSEYEIANVSGLKALVDVAMEVGVRRIVHVSSITVHGNDVRGAADESTPMRIEPNPYSWSKVTGERLLKRMIEQDRAPITIVRPGWIYGPRDRASFARFATQVRNGRMIVVGTGDNHVPLIHVRDVADGVIRAGEAEDAVGRTYLLVNDESVTQSDYLGAISSQLGVAPPRRRLPYRFLLAAGTLAESLGRVGRFKWPPPLTRYGVQLLGGENRFSIARARRELGFVPRIDLETGVLQSIDWYHSEYRARSAREH
jgi:nucleoside-diphosphate-sugar epimerase